MVNNEAAAIPGTCSAYGVEWEFATTEQDARAAYVRKHGREPEQVSQWSWWWYAGPVPRDTDTGSGQGRLL